MLSVVCVTGVLLFFTALEGVPQVSRLYEQTKVEPVRMPWSTAVDTCSMEGDPGIFIGFPREPQEVLAGFAYSFLIAPANFGFGTSPCQGADTFCLHLYDTEGWPVIAEGFLGQSEGECFELEPGYYIQFEVTITVPCSASAGEVDTLFAVMAYCDVNARCSPDCGDCMDPNWLQEDSFYSADTLFLIVEQSPPHIYILQDTLYYVDRMQTQAYVPFAVCNGDPCSPPADYVYRITSSGPCGNPVDQTDTLYGVPGGECEDVYATIYGPAYSIYDFDTLTFMAWDLATGTTSDTCVQMIYIIECLCVPVLDRRFVLISALMLISGAAVMLKIRRMR
jgi:hypothetical protein